jgi:hypothetical protein
LFIGINGVTSGVEIAITTSPVALLFSCGKLLAGLFMFSKRRRVDVYIHTNKNTITLVLRLNLAFG